MKALLLVSAIVFSVAFVSEANAVVCAKGVVKAGCAGPNGAAVVTKPVPGPVTGARVYRRP